MNNICEIYRNVSAWNAARYDQELNLDLAVSLLREEYEEYFKGKVAVDKVDALGDISYVALGICWKSGISETMLVEELDYWQDRMLASLDLCSGLEPIYLVPAFIDAFKYDKEFGIIDSMAAIINLCYFQSAYSYSMTHTDWKAVLTAICNSNDSKSVYKVDSDVKANAGNKGPNYVPPTAALVSILNTCVARKGLN